MIKIEFTEDEVAAMAYGYMYDATIRAKFIAALRAEICGHRCGCTSDDECPHDCDCQETT